MKKNNIVYIMICLITVLIQAAEKKFKKIELSLTHLLNFQPFNPKQPIGIAMDTLVQKKYNLLVIEPRIYKEKRKQSCQRVNCTNCESSSAFRYQLDILKEKNHTIRTISQSLQGIASLLHTDVISDPASQECYNTFKLIDLSESIKQCYTNNNLEIPFNAQSISHWKKTHKEPLGEFGEYWTFEKVLERVAEHNETARIAREFFLALTSKEDTTQESILS